MRVLLDLNILLDVFLAREPWLANSSAVLQSSFDGHISGCLSVASLPTIFYIVRRNANALRASAVLKECLDSFELLRVERATAESAFLMLGNDFEDNLQISCAVEAGLDAIVTRDPRGFALSPITVLTPAELLARIADTPGA